MGKLDDLYEDATPGPWYVSVKISEAICAKDESGVEKHIADLIACPRRAVTRPGQTRYSLIENARLIATLYNIGPHVIKLMEAAEPVMNLNLKKALRALKDAIDAQPTAAIIDESWRKADRIRDQKAALSPATQLQNKELTKQERRKLRRELRKEKRGVADGPSN